MSQFQFLAIEWGDIASSAMRAEVQVHSDPRAACFYCRRALELGINWLYRNDARLRLPYQDHLSALIHEPTFTAVVGPVVLPKLKLIKDLGNLAVHSNKPVTQRDALAAVRELFHFGYWLARTYGRRARPEPGLRFDADALPKPAPVAPSQADALRKLGEELAARDAKLSEVLSDRAAVDAELVRLRTEVAAAQQRNATQFDNHDYDEAATRDVFIDVLLKEAGWALDQERDREYPVVGMPNAKGEGFVDYVLWGNDGKPLAVVEAKRTTRDARVGQQQAKLYADCLEAMTGQRPLIFYTNGYEHWLWDDTRYPPRAVQGFYKKDELELAIARRSSRQLLADGRIDERIVERHYQMRAIRRVGESFERDKHRRALLVMATGAGKTRTVIALCDLLMRCGWAKRVLFLADRVALVNQAVGQFKTHLPSVAPVNLVTEKDGEGRVYVSTYPTMMGLIDEARDGARRFGVGHFDLVIVDEAHRSVYQKYGAIFDYFDSLLVGLTATPRGEVDRDTYKLFHIENGVPTDVYDIDDAVREGYLVPPKAVSVPLKFQREGIRYDDLSDEEKDAWDATEWSEDGDKPDEVGAEAVNRWLFNADTVDKVLAHLMKHGLHVADGDRLAKTIVFAKNQLHAQFIADRFDLHYPHLAGHFARVITFKTEYVQSLIEKFSEPQSPPHIALSVDMLDTGIDIPEVANLVFFKLVRSKTKFWQMLGRGTRLRSDLFGPGKDKECFYLFDFCQNLEFFSQNPAAADESIAKSLSARLFGARADVIVALDERLATRSSDGLADNESGLRDALAEHLRQEVAGMSLDNFLVRPKRKFVERYRETDAWNVLGRSDVDELGEHVAGLPSSFMDNDQAAKRFDLLMFKLQLAVIVGRKAVLLLQQLWPLNEKDRKAELESLGLWSWFRGFMRLRDQVVGIGSALAQLDNVPQVREQQQLIEDIQSDSYWFGVSAPILDVARRKLRALIRLIETGERRIVFTDFEDDIGEGTEIGLPGLIDSVNYERFRAKALTFLRAHDDHLTIRRLRRNEALTPMDLAELERIMIEAGVGSVEQIEQAKAENAGLGLFVRSLVGLERPAAMHAFDRFLAGTTLSAGQIQFVGLIVDHLTERGAMEAGLLYESPYTDAHPLGVGGLFTTDQVGDIRAVLDNVRMRAAA